MVHKLLSEYPSHYKDAPTEGIRRILEQVGFLAFLYIFYLFNVLLTYNVLLIYNVIPDHISF